MATGKTRAVRPQEERSAEAKAPLATGPETTFEERRAAANRLRAIDDVLFRCIAREYPDVVRHIIHLLPGWENADLPTVEAQKDVSNVLGGKSITLDAYVESSPSAWFDIEVEKSYKGAIPERPLTYMAILSALALKAGDPYEKLPAVTVIFVTAYDVLHRGKFLQWFRYADGDKILSDKAVIGYIYAKGAPEPDEEKLFALMQDFLQTDPALVQDVLLREAMIHFKEDEKGVEDVCEVIEELNALAAERAAKKAAKRAAKEAAKTTSREIALRMIAMGLSLAQISAATQLSEDEVRALAGEQSA